MRQCDNLTLWDVPALHRFQNGTLMGSRAKRYTWNRMVVYFRVYPLSRDVLRLRLRSEEGTLFICKAGCNGKEAWHTLSNVNVRSVTLLEPRLFWYKDTSLRPSLHVITWGMFCFISSSLPGLQQKEAKWERVSPNSANWFHKPWYEFSRSKK